jgi:hypothetical protein
VFEHHKLVAQDALIRSFWQSFDHLEAERLLTAGHPKDHVAIEHAQVHEINVGAVKNNDLPGLNSGAEFRGANAVGKPSPIRPRQSVATNCASPDADEA